MGNDLSINLLTHQWAKKNNLESFYFPETTSTNDVAKSLFPPGNEKFCLYLADHQSQGRGRKGHLWQNMKKGEILLSTWCFRLQKNVQPILTPLLGLALYCSLLEIKRDLPLGIKAPNDLHLNGAKLSGFLVESILQAKESFLLIGLGLNVFDSPKIHQKTTSMVKHLKVDDDLWFSLCDKIHTSFHKAILKGQQKTLCMEDIVKLKAALNFGLPEEEKYLSVSAECDLTNRHGTISWKDL